jgi:hypothetical protein
MRSEWISLFFLGLFTTFGCGPSGQTQTTESDSEMDSANDASSVVTCTSDLDCGANSLCTGGVCQTSFGSGPEGDALNEDEGASCLEIYDAISGCYTVYYDCASGCENQECADACGASYEDCYDAELALGSDQGATLFDALRTCEEDSYQDCYDEGGVLYGDCTSTCSTEACTEDCANQANQVLQNCLTEACFDEYSECNVLVDSDNGSGNTGNDSGNGDSGSGNGNNGGGSGEVTFSCGELYECEDACDGNTSCGQNCYDHGTSEAQSHWTSLIQCGQVYCDGNVADADEYRSCLQQMCNGQYNTCFNGSSGGGSSGGGGSGGNTGSGGFGTDTCGDGYSCIQSCYDTSTDENSFYACVDVCYGNMSTDAVVLMGDLSSCSNYECADVPGSLQNYYQCQQDFCSSEYNACVNHSNAGSSGTSTPGGSSNVSHDTCLDIYQSLNEVCSPEYNMCASQCSTDSCIESCSDGYNACVESQQDAAPASASSDFQDVLDCWSDNYDTCYAAGGTVYASCSDNCASWDDTCLSGCNDSANEAYQECYLEECAAEYGTCGVTDSETTTGTTEEAAAESLDSCLGIHLAVLDICVTAYDTCVADCSTDACTQSCVTDIQSCILDQQNAAPEQSAAEFQDVRDCRSENYDTCYSVGDTAYTSCVDACGGDTSCENDCNTTANDSYEECFFDTCETEYATCGIEE